MWPWCNLSASQRRPYSASVNSHSPVGLVRWQWEANDWACVLCDYCIHNDQASRSVSSWQHACPFYSSTAGFLAKHHITRSVSPLQSPDLAPCDFWFFPKLKSTLKGTRFVNATVTHLCTKFRQRCLTADWLAPRESDCSWIHSKVSSDSLPSYIKAMWPFLKIFKTAGYFLDSPHI